MKLHSLDLKNFRCFAQLTVEFHPQLTVLVANNGQGKTTILDALRIGLWPFVSSFDLATQNSNHSDPRNAIQISDARLYRTKQHFVMRGLPVEVILSGVFEDINRIWKRYRDSEKSGSKTKDDVVALNVRALGLELQRQVRNINIPPISLPVFGYYGTGRLWNEKQPTQGKRRNKEVIDAKIRTFAYLDCLNPASSYKQFEDCFISLYRQLREEQIKQLEAGINFPDLQFLSEIISPIQVIKGAVNSLLKITEWQNLSYSENRDQSLVLHHPAQGTLKVDQLSDGIKNMVAMVADIAYRCALLNPHLGAEAALKSEGVIMIDEVDMHLHPQWQQTVMAGLLTAFPNIQFIVTTHSPQVLSTVERENIRLLELDSNSMGTASIPVADSYGEPSHDVLQAIMQVDPQPPVPEKVDLERLTALVDQGLYQSEQAQQLLASLKERLSPSHPQIERIERSIRRQQALAR